MSLFAYRVAAAKARGAEGKTEEYRWLSQVNLKAIDDPVLRSEVARDLKAVFQEYGIPGVGKLKTHCRVHYQEWTPVNESTAAPLPDGLWIVTLQTPALLVAVAKFTEPASEDELRGLLEQYWVDVSGANMALDDYFARWELAGGEYLQSRQVNGGESYQPYLLVQPGSVFVLRATSTDATAASQRIRSWLETGLPIGRGVREVFGLSGDASDWEYCPYIPQNGFGEIAVNQALHIELALKEEELDATRP